MCWKGEARRRGRDQTGRAGAVGRFERLQPEAMGLLGIEGEQEGARQSVQGQCPALWPNQARKAANPPKNTMIAITSRTATTTCA